MKIFSKNKYYTESDQSHLSHEKQYDNGLVIKSEVLFLNDDYITYQQNLIWDFLEYLDEEVDVENFSLSRFKSIFEFALQELNSKLAVFAEKLKFGEKIHIRWFIEFFKDNYYVSSLIGDSSLVIFRKGRLFYSVHNANTDNKRIDLFSELIEWDVYDGDEILFFGNNVSYFTDKEDFENISDVIWLDDRSMIDISEDMLKERVSMDQIWFINMELVSTDSNYTWSKSKTFSRFNRFNKIRHRYSFNKYIMGIWFFGLIILTFLWLLISNFTRSQKGIKIWVEDGTGAESSSYFSLAGIRKDIDQFKALDPSAPEKLSLYEKLSNQIATIEKDGKLPLDIVELKKMLDYEYLKWFNIEQIDSLDQWLYEFNSNDLLDIWTPKFIFAKRTVSVAWSDGFLIGIINSQTPWTNVRSDVQNNLWGCTVNLQSNGLLCYNNDSSIVNVTKEWVNPVTIDGGAVQDIVSIGTFGNGNMYLLTKDDMLNSQWTYIVRYPIAPGAKNTFRTPIYYNMPSDQIFMSWWAMGFTDFTIDGKFLLRSPNDRNIYQYRRAGNDANARKVPLQWWDAITTLWSGIKLMTYQNSNFVYLYDKWSQTLLVYKSSPNKTSEPSQYTYSLKYIFAVKLNQPKWTIADIVVGDDVKPLLYILTDKWVATLPFYNYLDSYSAISDN